MNCTVNWPCSRSEILEVIENIGSGKCTCNINNNNKKNVLRIWYKFMAMFS